MKIQRRPLSRLDPRHLFRVDLTLALKPLPEGLDGHQVIGYGSRAVTDVLNSLYKRFDIVFVQLIEVLLCISSDVPEPVKVEKNF